MLRWRRSDLLLSSVASLACAAAGCLAGERKSENLPIVDHAMLLNLPGSQPAIAARSQKPQPSASPLELGDDAPGSKAARSARIRAVVNGEAILDEEVIASAFQQLMAARSDAEKAEILNKKLTEIIERELLLQDASARLGRRQGFMTELKTIADREFNKQWLERLMRANKYTDPEAFKRYLEDQGMPVAMIRRQWVRNFIAMEYIRSRIEPSVTKIGHLDIVEYYNKQGQDFQVEEHLVWQDIFIAHARHGGSVEAARRFAESLVVRIRKGEDFVRLSNEFDNGESSLRDKSAGMGEKRGEIRPREAEPILFSLKDNEVGPLIENEAGFHIVRLISHVQAGRQPLDEKLQKEIKEKIRAKVFETEMKRIISDLKSKAIIEVANQIK